MLWTGVWITWCPGLASRKHCYFMPSVPRIVWSSDQDKTVTGDERMDDFEWHRLQTDCPFGGWVAGLVFWAALSQDLLTFGLNSGWCYSPWQFLDWFYWPFGCNRWIDFSAGFIDPWSDSQPGYCRFWPELLVCMNTEHFFLLAKWLVLVSVCVSRYVKQLFLDL